MISSLSSSVKDFYYYVSEREGAIAPVATPTERMWSVVDWPLRQCQWVADVLAAKTISLAVPLLSIAPVSVKKKYDLYLESQVDKVMVQLQKPLQNETIFRVVTKIFNWLKELLAEYLPPKVLAWAEKIAPVVADKSVEALRAKVKATVSELHNAAAKESAQQALGFIYGFGTQYAMYSCLEGVAGPYIATHTNVYNSLLLFRISLMAYVYGPTVYKCAQFGKSYLDVNRQANQFAKLFESEKGKEIVEKVATHLNVSKDFVIKTASLLAAEVQSDFIK